MSSENIDIFQRFKNLFWLLKSLILIFKPFLKVILVLYLK